MVHPLSSRHKYPQIRPVSPAPLQRCDADALVVTEVPSLVEHGVVLAVGMKDVLKDIL